MACFYVVFAFFCGYAGFMQSPLGFRTSGFGLLSAFVFRPPGFTPFSPFCFVLSDICVHPCSSVVDLLCFSRAEEVA